MIAAAYLVLTICGGPCDMRYHVYGGGDFPPPMTSQSIPQPSMDQCIRQANAFNKHRKDTRAMCVPGAEK